MSKKLVWKMNKLQLLLHMLLSYKIAKKLLNRQK